MRIAKNIIGVLLVLIGALFFLQGIRVLLGSVMTGQTQWAVIGGIMFVVGIVMLFSANRRRISRPQ